MEGIARWGDASARSRTAGRPCTPATRGACASPVPPVAVRRGSGDAFSDRGPEEPKARAIRGAARSRARSGRPTAFAFSGACGGTIPPARTPLRQARHPHGAQARGRYLIAALRRAPGCERLVTGHRPSVLCPSCAAGRGGPDASPLADALRRARLRDAGEALRHGLLRVARGEPGAGAAASPAAHHVLAPGLRGADLALVEVGAVPPPRPQDPLGRQEDPPRSPIRTSSDVVPLPRGPMPKGPGPEKAPDREWFSRTPAVRRSVRPTSVLGRRHPWSSGIDTPGSPPRHRWHGAR